MCFLSNGSKSYLLKVGANVLIPEELRLLDELKNSGERLNIVQSSIARPYKLRPC